MNQKHVLAQHLSNVNTVIKQPLQFTQRIKFTCFDVSQNYIVFGATSGGLYVYNRYPNVFIKLIPSKQGSVVQVCISPNEKTIALASSKGLVVILQNCFVETNIQYQIFSEHESNTVTAMKWHMDEIYCGDSRGKVSVITLPSLLTKAIFQSPCASLMQLDSSIFQIECYSKYLLVSTYTRTYICDTDKEQYRQIGKKLRDGPFGACFFNDDTNSDTRSIHSTASRGLFKKIKEDEQFIAQINDNVKIFCARPGTRMWEAKLDATVTRTHQFKNFFKRSPTSLIQLGGDTDSHLIINSHADFTAPELLNFSKVFMMENKFIITFNSEGFYVFDPEKSLMICWCNQFRNIKDIKITKNFIYIWDENFEVHVVAVYSLEKIILKSLFEKQYYICSELCINYMKDVLELVETSDKIHLVSFLREKLTELSAKDLITQLEPLFIAIKEFSDKKNISQRLATGIVVVNNSYIGKDMISDEPSEAKCERDQHIPETFQTLKEIGSNVTDKLTVGTKNFKEKLQIFEATVKNLTLDTETCRDNFSRSELEVPVNENTCKYKDICKFEEDDDVVVLKASNIDQKNIEAVTEIDFNLKIFLQQYQSSKINNKLEIPKFNELLVGSNLNTVVDLFLNFFEHMLSQNAEEIEIKLWCYQYYLKHLSNIDFENEIKYLNLEERPFQYLFEAFCSLNFSPKNGCGCMFPLPLAKVVVPHYYEVGCAMIKKLWDTKNKLFEKILKDVPFVWKYAIRELRNNDDINILLPLLVQYGDTDLIAIFSSKFKYDIWDNAVQLLIKLKKMVCVNCDKKFDEMVSNIMDWTEFGKLMVQSIGGPSTLHLLTRYAEYIPNHELSSDFYQSCMFTTAVDGVSEGFRKEAINLTKVVHSDRDTTLQFQKMLALYLQKNYVQKPVKYVGNDVLPVRKTDLKCSFCDLPLEIPVLKKASKLKCDHLYHSVCLTYNKDICVKCKD